MRAKKIAKNKLQAIVIIATTLTTTPLIIINNTSKFTEGELMIRVISQGFPVENAHITLVDVEKKKQIFFTNSRGYALSKNEGDENKPSLKLESGAYQLSVFKKDLRTFSSRVYIPEAEFVEKIVSLEKSNNPPIPVMAEKLYFQPNYKYLLDGSKSYDPDKPEVEEDQILMEHHFRDEYGNPNGKRIEKYTWGLEGSRRTNPIKIFSPNQAKTDIIIREAGTYGITLSLSDGLESSQKYIQILCDHPIRKLGNLLLARGGHSSTILNGEAYIIGGWNQTYLGSVEKYDFYEDKWKKSIPLNITRNHHLSYTLNDQIFVIGGHNARFPGGIAAVEKFDPLTQKWDIISQLPTPRYNMGGGVYNNKIYTFGGIGGETILEVYDPDFNTWERKKNMPVPRFRHSTSFINGKFYLIGGKGTATLVQEYDPDMETWNTKSPMPIPRYYHSSIVLNNKIYVIGGKIPDRSEGVKGISQYNPVKDEWDTLSDLPKPVDVHSMNVFDNKIYIFGGEGLFGTTSVLKSTYTYDPRFAKIGNKKIMN